MSGLVAPKVQGPRSREDRGEGGTCSPPIFLKLLRVSKRKRLVPHPQYRVTNGARSNLKVAPRSLKFDRFQLNYTQQLPTTANIVVVPCKRTQLMLGPTISSLLSVDPTMLRPFVWDLIHFVLSRPSETCFLFRLYTPRI